MHKLTVASVFLLAACGNNTISPDAERTGKDPDTAEQQLIDRFSPEAGTLWVRDQQNGLPAAGAPIDLDQQPFVTQGLGPAGQVIRYYNFDFCPYVPSRVFVLYRAGETTPVAGQLPIFDTIPGDAGYNDFRRISRVTVPAGYVANVFTSIDELGRQGYPIEVTTSLLNAPLVPAGSTATQRDLSGDASLLRGWYNDKVVYYFVFEDSLEVVADGFLAGQVPISYIYVTFNINPGDVGGGPPSGFVTEPQTSQTHNVVKTIALQPNYSPLWQVNFYDNADFDSVSDLASAEAATRLGGTDNAINCPVVFVEGR